MHLLSLMYHRSKIDHYRDLRDIRTRQFDKIKFKVIHPVMKKEFKGLNFFGAQLWDMLPKDTQSQPTYHLFKLNVKRHIAAGLFKKCN